MGLQYEQPWLKGQPWPLELINSHGLIKFNINSHGLIKFNISSEGNDFGFNSIQKN